MMHLGNGDMEDNGCGNYTWENGYQK